MKILKTIGKYIAGIIMAIFSVIYFFKKFRLQTKQKKDPYVDKINIIYTENANIEDKKEQIKEEKLNNEEIVDWLNKRFD